MQQILDKLGGLWSINFMLILTLIAKSMSIGMFVLLN